MATNKDFIVKNGLQVGGDIVVTGSLQTSGLTLPASDGTSGQVIATDGNGNLSFQTIVSNFTISDGTNTDTFNTGETLTFTAGTGITTTVSNNVVTISGATQYTDADAIAAVEGATHLTIDGGTLYVDTSNNYVGIGDTSPQHKLDVAGGIGINGTEVIDTSGEIVTAQLKNSGVTAGSYGSASLVPVITIDAKGRITSASTTSVAGVSTFTYNSSTNTLNISTADGGSFDADISAIGGSIQGTLADTKVQYGVNYSGTPQQGSFFFDSLNQKLKVYTGSTFVDAVPAGTGGGGGDLTDAVATFEKFQYTVTTTTNAISGADDNSNTLSYVVDGSQNIEVYVNGIKQFEGASNDYVATTGTSVTFTYNLVSGDVVDIQVYELLTQDAFYLKSETYTKTETNTQISTAVSSYLPLTGGTISGNISITGTVDGRDISVDGSKLDGIEAGATADQTKADIDALGINAGTLDGLDSSQFLRSDTSDTMSGALTIDPSTNGITALQIGARSDSNEYYDAYLQASDDGVSTGFNIQRRTQIGTSNQQRLTGVGIVSMGQNWKLSRYFNSTYTTAIEMDYTTGNVGIGTSSPSTILHIKGNGAGLSIEGTLGTGSTHVIESSGSNNATLAFRAAQRFYFTANGQDRMVLDSNGNLGIGTTQPWDKLSVYGGGIHFGTAPNVNNSGRLTYNTTSGEMAISAHSTGGNTSINLITSSGGSLSTRVNIESDGTTNFNGPKINLPTGASDPSGAVDGSIYFNTSTKLVRVYSNGAWSDVNAEKDPYWANVSAYITGDGVDRKGAWTITPVNVSTSTSPGSPFAGNSTSSWYEINTGTNNYLSLAGGGLDLIDPSEHTNFTLEFWLYRSATGGSYGHFYNIGGQGGQGVIKFQGDSAYGLYWYSSNGELISWGGGGSLTTGTWNWYVYQKSGSTNRTWKNGTLINTNTNSLPGGIASYFQLGGPFGSEYVSHYFDHLRVTAGVARYGSASTIPVQDAPWPTE